MAAVHHRLVTIGEFSLTLPNGRVVTRLQEVFSPSPLQIITYNGHTYTADSAGTFYGVPEDLAEFLLTHATDGGRWFRGPASTPDTPVIETSAKPETGDAPAKGETPTRKRNTTTRKRTT
jgi:hypothetical protein